MPASVGRTNPSGKVPAPPGSLSLGHSAHWEATEAEKGEQGWTVGKHVSLIMGCSVSCWELCEAAFSYSLSTDFGEESKTANSILSLFNRPEVNIRKYDNSISIISSNGKSWNQKHFALTFPKPPQPGRKNRSRPLKLQNTVPNACHYSNQSFQRQDKIKSKEDQKKAHIWIRHSLRKIFQRPSIYLAVRRQAPFRCSYISKAHLEKAEAKESQDGKKRRDLKKDSKKKTGPHTTTLESKKIIKDKKPKESNKAAKIPSKSSHENEPYKQSNSKLDTNSESKDSKEVSKKDQTKDKKDSKNCKGTDTTCTKTEPKKDSKNSSKKDPDAESETYSKNHSNMDSVVYLEISGTESMDFDAWLNNYSQNNSKKPSKKDTKKDSKKASDGESVDSKDAKKDSKKEKTNAKKDSKKKDAKKDAKKDTDSTDVESVGSKDSKKGKKNAKKDSKKDAKKDADSTDAESVDSKNVKKDEKKDKKDSKKDTKKEDTKKNTVSTESESELESKKSKKDEKKDKRDPKKDDKKKDAKKDVGSTDAESEFEWESKKDKKDAKKDTKKGAKMNTESTDASSDDYSKKGLSKPLQSAFKDSDAESDQSLYKLGAKNRGVESDATSIDSKKEGQGLKREFKTSYRKTMFRDKEKKPLIGRVPPSRERPPLPPCEPLTPSPKLKRPCRCRMPPPPSKPRYAPLNAGFMQAVNRVCYFFAASPVPKA
ncbi:cylicin-1 [Loxodonta africana]|uniref:cylicin-1 n=1 Tax=Loxodonta africana TaxID=9785 RepID=UPI0030D1A2C9